MDCDGLLVSSGDLSEGYKKVVGGPTFDVYDDTNPIQDAYEKDEEALFLCLEGGRHYSWGGLHIRIWKLNY